MLGNSVHRWSILTLICIAILAAVSILVVHQTYFSQVEDSKEWVDHTQAMIDETQDISGALQRAIISQRAYLLMRKKTDLATYREQSEIVKSRFDSLRSRVRNDDQRSKMETIAMELEKLWGMLDEGVNAILNREPETAFSDSLTREMFTLVTQVQDDLEAFLRENRTLLLARAVEEREVYRHYIRMMLVASLLSLLTLAGISLSLFRVQARQVAIEEELKTTKERLDLAIRGASDGVWDWNVKTGDVYYSPRYKEIIGYDDEAFANRIEAFNDAIHPDDREKVWTYAHQYLAQEVSDYQSTFRMVHKDGSVRWVLSRGIALWNSKGEPYRMVGVHTDITAQKKLEDALREAMNKAEIASHAKTEFLANMSHEIRTPMNAIIGIANILARNEHLTDRQRECIEALQTGANALHGLLNDILDLSKLESGMVTLEEMPFSLSKLVTEATTLAGFRAHEKHLSLHVSVSELLPENLLGDALRIRQVINNLLSNAIKFTNEGTVSLHVGATPAGESTENWTVEIRVRDSGIGIPPERQQAIFEKFTQSDASIARQFGGTGLGLAICRQLVEQMHGSIRLESNPGEGSEFIVTLPLKSASQQHTGASMPLSEPVNDTRRKGTVFVVEDYKPNILVVRNILEDQGYTCETATTGKEALAKLCGKKPHRFIAILMDVQLPDMDGFEITRRVRAHEKEHHLHATPIIAMTAHALLDDRERCLAAGMDDYIAKPFDPENFSEKLAAVIAENGDAKLKDVA